MSHRIPVSLTTLDPAPRGLLPWAWLVVLAAYVVIYGSMLLSTAGLPYTIDNNESFSSLVHAKNLAQFDFGKSYGLTDESYALTEAGHPYIHSHQGNFPRIFAFTLYLLGARSIESQIWLTTFTVGLAAIWLAFRFGQRLGGPWFGALACLVLMTDYVLFAQWQVNTYRVWHAFFFFSSLECVHLAGRSRRWLAWGVVVANFASLFYWEYVFGAFVGLMTALYALLIHRRAWRPLGFTWSGIFCGGLLAATTLLSQLTAYMGWVNVLRDIRYTLLARNSASDAAFAAEVNAFYDRHHVLFWQNYLDTTALKSWSAAWRGILEFHWEYTSPTLTALTLFTLVAWAVATLPPRSRFATLAGRRRSFRWPEWLARYAVLAVGMSPFLRTIETIAGRQFISSSILWETVACLLLPAGLAGLWFGRISGLLRLGCLRLIMAGLFFYTAHAALAGWPALEPGQPAGMSPQTLIGWLHDSWAGVAAVGMVAGIALSLLLLGPAQVLGRRPARGIGRLTLFLAAVTGAYIAIYLVFTGYVFSGYLHRQAPLLVFVTDLLLAGAFAVVAQSAFRLASRHFAKPAGRPAHRLLATAMAAAAVVLVQGWGSLQAGLLAAVPPTNYQFLRQLKDPPYRGASFAVSTYAAPISAYTGSWAYFESTLFTGKLELGRNGWSIPRDHQYLWFADRLSNPAYHHPDYALTIIQPDNVARSLERMATRTGHTAETNGLFQRARTPFQPFLHHRVMASDGSNYSLVRLDWDYPPYLKSHDTQVQEFARQLTMDQKLALSATAREMARRWRIEVELPATVDLASIGLACDERPVAFERRGPNGPLGAVVNGNSLQLQLHPTPQGGRVRITVNDATEQLDLPSAGEEVRTFTWAAGQPHGKHTRVPTFPPGFHVQTTLKVHDGLPCAELTYHFAHQEGSPEADTLVRLYAETADNQWRLIDAITFLGSHGVPVRLPEFRRDNPDTVAEYARISAQGERRSYEQWLADFLFTHPAEWARPGVVREAWAGTREAGGSTVRRLPLPDRPASQLQYSVTPATRTKAGLEYFGLVFSPDSLNRGLVAFAAPTIKYGASDLPFGRLQLKLRFPTDRTLQAEPIVTTGSNEAGDVVYVIYDDPTHIRLGFDHWFKGGPVTKPIAIDLTREHELEISIGSLYPSTEDIVFIGLPVDVVMGVKNRVLIKLDGQTVIDSEGSCYDSSPDQITVGRNTIRATSSGPVFNGDIISTTRSWPWPN